MQDRRVAAAYMLGRREGSEVIGLTSARNVQFVENLGIYSRVVGYDALDSLEGGPATFVDFAGDGKVRLAVHSHYDEELVQSIEVGFTHRGGLEPGESELPGPSPTFFFAPDRVTKRSADWGRARLGASVAEAWHPFCEWTGGWLERIRGKGFPAVESAYLDVLEGRVAPDRAHVISLA
jgi:hypothetical protein